MNQLEQILEAIQEMKAKIEDLEIKLAEQNKNLADDVVDYSYEESTDEFEDSNAEQLDFSNLSDDEIYGRTITVEALEEAIRYFFNEKIIPTEQKKPGLFKFDGIFKSIENDLTILTFLYKTWYEDQKLIVKLHVSFNPNNMLTVDGVDESYTQSDYANFMTKSREVLWNYHIFHLNLIDLIVAIEESKNGLPELIRDWRMKINEQ